VNTLRFDGIYQSGLADGYWHYLRFYANGTVLTTSSPDKRQGVGPNAVNLRETSGPSHLGVIPAEEILEVPIGILIFSPDPVFLIRGFSSDIVVDRAKTDAPV
jgi:hypothetical protein